MLASETGIGWLVLALLLGFTVSLGVGGFVTDLSIEAGKRRIKKSIQEDESLTEEERTKNSEALSAQGRCPEA